MFHKIAKPITQLINNKNFVPENDSAKKLVFNKFLTLLLYYYLMGIDSLRSLITDLKTNDNISKIDLSVVGISTIHDAFFRYRAIIFQKIYCYLLKTLPVYQIDEFKELGRFILTDGSIFPMAISNFWAEFKKRSKALKLHLCFELNQMIPTYFLVTNAKCDERKVLAIIIEQAVTYIADRGYLSFDLFNKIVEKQAFFIIRVRKNLTYKIKKELSIRLVDAVKYIFFQVTDELVEFGADKYQHVYRRITFKTGNTLFVLVTNRLDLTTYQIIRLYAFRWQIELFFRYFKRTLKAIHLINNSQNGITIQFYLILIVNLLLLKYKQEQMQSYLFSKKQENKNSDNKQFSSPEEFIKCLSGEIPINFKIEKQEILAIRNLMFKHVQLQFDFF